MTGGFPKLGNASLLLVILPNTIPCKDLEQILKACYYQRNVENGVTLANIIGNGSTNQRPYTQTGEACQGKTRRLALGSAQYLVSVR